MILTVPVYSQSAPDAEIRKLNAEMAELYSKGDLKGAQPLANRIVELNIQKFGKNDLQTAKALKNRGFIENAVGDTKRSSDTLDDAADIFKRFPDMSKSDASSFAQLLELLGGMRLRDRLPSAKGTLELALRWREKASGPDSPTTATPTALLASYYFWNREYKKSSELYERALLTLAKVSSQQRDELTTVYYRTECAFRKAKIESDFQPLKAMYDGQLRIGLKKQTSLINGGVLNGKALELKKPAYPAEARNARAEGSVEVEILIGEHGEILSACAVENAKAHTALIEASEIAAYNSKFAPTTLAGLPVKVAGRLVYNFKAR